MDNDFGLLGDDEVIFVRSGRILMPNPTFKVSELLDALAQAVSEREEDWTEESEGWFGAGLPCEVLRFGNQGWQRGRVRIRIEFCPEKQPKLLRDDSHRRTNRENLYVNREDVYTSREESYPARNNEFYEDDLDAEY
ncbi:MAG TPA: KGK domain-containing protein [Crinalium sp.]|jgi:hypothetical protein